MLGVAAIKSRIVWNRECERSEVGGRGGCHRNNVEDEDDDENEGSMDRAAFTVLAERRRMGRRASRLD